jgi:hypothetical protein
LANLEVRAGNSSIDDSQNLILSDFRHIFRFRASMMYVQSWLPQRATQMQLAQTASEATTALATKDIRT